MKKILVTGGAGFIGSNFIRYMFNHHTDVSIINLDSLTYAGNLENLKDIEQLSNYKFIKGNICDKTLVENIFRDYDIDYCVHFAAESHVDRSIIKPEVFIETNVLGTLVLLDAAKKYWADNDGFTAGKKFIQISTDEVYGSLGKDGYFTEQTPLAPNSPYSASKASADLLALSYWSTYKLPINITRCSNNYGPYQFPEKLIPLMINNAINNKPLPVYGDGLNIRDWLYVDDHARAIDLVIEKGIVGEVYNIGGHNEKCNIEIVKTILKTVSQLSNSNANENLITYVEDRKGHDRRYAIDPNKISSELNWKPQIEFDNGIIKTVEWYLNHTEWLENIATGAYRQI